MEGIFLGSNATVPWYLYHCTIHHTGCVTSAYTGKVPPQHKDSVLPCRLSQRVMGKTKAFLKAWFTLLHICCLLLSRVCMLTGRNYKHQPPMPSLSVACMHLLPELIPILSKHRYQRNTLPMKSHLQCSSLNNSP